jgi:hypothetical protein
LLFVFLSVSAPVLGVFAAVYPAFAGVAFLCGTLQRGKVTGRTGAAEAACTYRRAVFLLCAAEKSHDISYQHCDFPHTSGK